MLCNTSALYSQQIARESMMALIAKIPTIPSNILAADKSPDVVYGPFEAEVMKITEQKQPNNSHTKKEILDAGTIYSEAQEKDVEGMTDEQRLEYFKTHGQGNTGMPNAGTLDLAEKLKDPTFKARFEAMSTQEKMEYLKQSGIMNTTTRPKAESPEVSDARRKAAIFMSDYQRWQQLHIADIRSLIDTLNNNMESINAMFVADFALLPVLKEGQEITKEYRSKNLALMNSYHERKTVVHNKILIDMLKRYNQNVAELKKLCTPLDDALKAIGYGDKLTNNPMSTTESELAAAQNAMLQLVAQLESNAKDAYIIAYEGRKAYFQRKERIAKQEIITESELSGF